MAALSDIAYAIYSIAGILLIIYFCWENGPHHRSHRMEVSYFIFVLFLLTMGTMLQHIDPSTPQRRADAFCYGHTFRFVPAVAMIDWMGTFYLCLHVFVSLIPSTSDQLEGVPLTPGVKVSHSVLRKVRDIEHLVYDTHESGPAGE